ncbi:MAG: hypothetical protein KAV82_11095 [Phycisphaerae bacterium]|nr:hypothetical protein [Phycisphaerae bacterium]
MNGTVPLGENPVIVEPGSAQDVELIHASIVMHNEEPPGYPDFANDEPTFWQHRNGFVSFVNMLSANGVMFNYQSDWKYTTRLDKAAR